MVVGALGAGLAVGLVHRVAPEAAGSGIPHVKAVLYWFRSMRWQAILLVKFVGGVVGIGSGLALGGEGPTVKLAAPWALPWRTGWGSRRVSARR